MANAVVLWVIVYLSVTSVNTKDTVILVNCAITIKCITDTSTEL